VSIDKAESGIENEKKTEEREERRKGERDGLGLCLANKIESTVNRSAT